MNDYSAISRRKITGYCDRLTVRPGETIDFKVSVESGSGYYGQLVQLINGDTVSNVGGFKEKQVSSSLDGSHEGIEQPVYQGSFIAIEKKTVFEPLDNMTVALRFMPTLPQFGIQQLIGRWNAKTNQGWSLYINQQGILAFRIEGSDGLCFDLTVGQVLKPHCWYQACVSLVYPVCTLSLSLCELNHQPQWQDAVELTVTGLPYSFVSPKSSAPLMMAAAYGGQDHSGRIIPRQCFNGRLESPFICSGEVSLADVDQLLGGKHPLTLTSQILARWDFSQQMTGTNILDQSKNLYHGYTHNLPLRAVRGSLWDGHTHEWQRALQQYAAIHFHSDDLYDCGWSTSLSYQLPDDMQSGVYALRLRHQDYETSTALTTEEYLPFFVAAGKNKPQSKLAFIVPTYTYMAYANSHPETGRKQTTLSVEDYYAASFAGPGVIEQALLSEHHQDLGLSIYDYHLDGSPVHFSSCLRPMLNMRPKLGLYTFGSDLLMIDWLEAKGIAYDIITDDLLQQEGCELLAQYAVVMSGNHPEYPSTEQLDAIRQFTEQGGRFMYMGGNGYYWRAGVHNNLPGVIEVRRGRTGSGTWKSAVGESCLQFDGKPGGIWRDLGRPPQQLFGVGFIAEGRGASHYRITSQARQERTAFILKGIEVGTFGYGGIFGGAAGQEIDQLNLNHGSPEHAVIIARSEHHSDNMLFVIEEMYPLNPDIADYRQRTYADIVFFETTQGGAVFSVGSMTWCGCLSENGYSNPVSLMTANVIERFSDDAPL